MTDPITETDLLAYVDDQLEMPRRIEVEHYLACTPDAAAQIMADLRSRDALRLAFTAALPRPSQQLFQATSRLQRGLAFQRVGQRVLRAASVVLLVGFGWLAHTQVGLFEITDSEASSQPPTFVEDALRSHQTALLRARMVSQVETADYDPAEILAETGIQLPPLPREWQVVDAQVFPSLNGHGVELAIDAEALGRVSLFATQATAFTVIAPTIARFGGTHAAYWQTGHLAYALTGNASENTLERAAIQLSRKLQ